MKKQRGERREGERQMRREEARRETKRRLGREVKHGMYKETKREETGGM